MTDSNDQNNVTRRNFVKTAGAAAAAATLAAPASALASVTSAKRRYAIVGTGSRAIGMWGRDLVQKYSDVLEFVGLCDVNHKRVAVAKEAIGANCPTFTSFDEMMDKAKPDLLMVTTVDGFHHEYITKGLARGADVMTEKPMVINEEQIENVLAAEKKANKKIVVTFNYRYAPKHQKIKEILLSGELGNITSVDFSWFLDVRHGADYFRRWHRLKNKGGSLWVHKATHHFDLVNWWLAADPVEVFAHGELNVYGRANDYRHTHCRPCPHKAKCPFYFDITKVPSMMRLYVACEDVDNYHRDGCVFREDVDIYDTMSALVRYSNNVTMNYSLNAYLPIEGYRLTFDGEKGRLEVRDFERQPWQVAEETEMYLTKSFGQREKITVQNAEGGHGGGDDRLRDLIFRAGTQVPDYMRLPDSRAGAMSCLTGIAARTSVEKRRPVRISDLAKIS